MTAATVDGPAGRASERAAAFVDAHREAAVALGRRLVEEVGDPSAFADVLRGGLRSLADPEYQSGQHLVAPGLGATHGVRNPLLQAAARAFLKGSARTSSMLLLFVAERLLREPELEARWFAIHVLEATLAPDPERTWQLLRRAARDADDWITVDTLAHPLAAGILQEPYRWAEIEQLSYSPSRWERRLVGSTIASMPFVDRKAGRTAEYVRRSLAILGDLIGDADPDVQKSLAWAYRSVALVDAVAVIDALHHEAAIAVRDQDGHRAWVIRDALARLEEPAAIDLKRRLEGIRRRSDGAATSRASSVATEFRDAGLGRRPDDPPLI